MNLTRQLLAAALAFTGCAVDAQTVRIDPVPSPMFTPCVTRCGMGAFQPPDSEACRSLQALENEAIQSYSTHVGWKPAAFCSSLRGWLLLVHPHADARGVWATDGVLGHEGVVYVLGLTNCANRTIFVGSNEWRTTAYVHELGHVGDCLVENLVGANHEGWRTRGHCTAINAVSALQDSCSSYD